MSFTLKSYASSIVKSDAENAADLAPLKVQEMQSTLTLKTVKLQAEIAKQNAAVSKLVTAYPIDFDRLSDALDELQLAERQLTQFQAIAAQLFPPNSAAAAPEGVDLAHLNDGG